MKLIIVQQVVGKNDVTGEEFTTPTAINTDVFRYFHPRKNDAIGSRITFEDGGGWAVTDTFAELQAKLAAAGIPMAKLTMIKDIEAVVDDETGEVLNAADEGHTEAVINPASIRCFYPRKHGKAGTRITFARGSGIAVTDLMEAVTALVA